MVSAEDPLEETTILNQCVGAIHESPLHIEILKVTDSTNLQMHHRAGQEAPEGTVLIADRQTEGRGRLGRVWESPPGKNLYISILLRPSLSPAAALPLTLVTGVACYEALFPFFKSERAHGRAPLRLKWPNDLWMGSKKMGGILTEMEAEQGQVKFVVVGLGLNINAVASDFSEELRPLVTSLFLETQKTHSRNEIAGRVLNSFFETYQTFLQNGFEPIRKKWEAYAGMKGEKVQVLENDRSFEGVCEGLDGDGFLLVSSPSGIEKVIAGDVRWI